MSKASLDHLVMVSADSHVIEPADLWDRGLPSALRSSAPKYPDLALGQAFQAHPGGRDPKARVGEMAEDGVSGEVLYPSLALDQYGLTDVAMQEACFRVYNDWLAEYCSYAPDRLYGVAMISTYDVDHAVAELTRCREAGLRGALVWQIPPDELSFASDHYDRFWAAAQELEMPVSMHTITGAPYPPREIVAGRGSAVAALRKQVNIKLTYVSNTLGDLIASGVFVRFPKLKMVLVENEASWLPFVLSMWDKYCGRSSYDTTMTKLPSEYFKQSVFVTFFNDPTLRWLFRESDWETHNCMWSSDYPHKNSTWPNSRDIIARDLAELDDAARSRVTAGNVQQLYNLPVVELVNV